MGRWYLLQLSIMAVFHRETSQLFSGLSLSLQKRHLPNATFTQVLSQRVIKAYDPPSDGSNCLDSESGNNRRPSDGGLWKHKVHWMCYIWKYNNRVSHEF